MTTRMTDDKIVELAQKTDKFILDAATETGANALEFSAIALGRLMVFCQSVGAYKDFHKMMETVVAMGEPTEPIVKQETQESP